MKNLLTLIVCLTSSIAVQAQDRTKDSISIVHQIDAMVSSWNRHDYSDMEKYISKDCEWINIVGMWWKNSQEVQHAHQAYHKSMFKNTSMVKKQVKIRYLAENVALIHLISGVGSFITPEGTTVPEMDDLATLIYIRQKDKWLLRAGANVQIDPMAQQFDPVKTLAEVK